jgi:diguanylate cyclase (GGDEF)-like protein
MAEKHLALLRTIAEALDGLEVALCVFDDEDRTQLWNRSFLRFFPEHGGQVHAGEPYRDNLRRFYGVRLGPNEIGDIERFIVEGIARHRQQLRPYDFKHRGQWLRVSSLALPGLGRVRLWRQQPPPRLAGTEAALAGAVPAPLGNATDIFEHVGDAVMLTSADSLITWVNENFVEMYRLGDKAAAIGATLEDVYRTAWYGQDRPEQARRDAGLATLVENMRFAGAPFELPLPGARWVRVIEQRRRDGVGFFAHVDISLLKRQQEDLIEAERRARASEALLAAKSRLLEATLERMDQGVLMVNAEGRVDVCNRRAIELLELPAALMDERPSHAAVLAHQPAIAVLAALVAQPQRQEVQLRSGHVVEVQSVPIAGGGVLHTYADITERKGREERIRHVARHDGLTSLVNRETFLEHVNVALAAPGVGFAVHYLDLDDFKPVNDRLGHAVGDKVLALVAARLRGVARDGDIAGRMGGDEFAMLQSGVADAEQARRLAERMIASVREPIGIEGHTVQVGLSIGIALHPVHGADTDSLMRHADSALYAAKAGGRGGARVFGETDARGT